MYITKDENLNYLHDDEYDDEVYQTGLRVTVTLGEVTKLIDKQTTKHLFMKPNDLGSVGQ